MWELHTFYSLCEKDVSKVNERLTCSSNFSISKLTPKSQQRRLVNTKRERLRAIGKLKIYEKKISELQVELDSEQNLEMEQIIDWINKNMVNTLETISADGLDHG